MLSMIHARTNAWASEGREEINTVTQDKCLGVLSYTLRSRKNVLTQTLVFAQNDIECTIVVARAQQRLNSRRFRGFCSQNANQKNAAAPWKRARSPLSRLRLFSFLSFARSLFWPATHRFLSVGNLIMGENVKRKKGNPKCSFRGMKRGNWDEGEQIHFRFQCDCGRPHKTNKRFHPQVPTKISLWNSSSLMADNPPLCKRFFSPR